MTGPLIIRPEAARNDYGEPTYSLVDNRPSTPPGLAAGMWTGQTLDEIDAILKGWGETAAEALAEADAAAQDARQRIGEITLAKGQLHELRKAEGQPDRPDYDTGQYPVIVVFKKWALHAGAPEGRLWLAWTMPGEPGTERAFKLSTDDEGLVEENCGYFTWQELITFIGENEPDPRLAYRSTEQLNYGRVPLAPSREGKS